VPDVTPEEFAYLLSLAVAGVFVAAVIGIGIWLMRRHGESR
jgi:hypothetical protein